MSSRIIGGIRNASWGRPDSVSKLRVWDQAVAILYILGL